MLEIIKGTLLDKYASISGRANRTEYWLWVLCQFVLGIVVSACMAVSDTLYYVLSGIVTVALLLPSICVAIRRLHDTGRGGGWCFIALIPLVGAIWLLVLMLLPGEPETNRFGDVPTTSL